MQHSLLKRIRRHVSGRVQDFFAVTSPGFEQICFDELTSLPLSFESVKIVTGGVEFKARLQDCYLANLNLRTATRILMRICTFKASNFSQLEKKISDIPWELFLSPEHLTHISVTSKHSRLFHKEAIAGRFQAGIIQRFAASFQPLSLKSPLEGGVGRCVCTETSPLPPSKGDSDVSALNLTASGEKGRCFVRVSDDRFTVSIDSSGEMLYKRGIKKQGGAAPLRETIAAAALTLAGYDSDAPLIDPLCGSGTFSLEAAMRAKHIPPGWLREFAFMEWPSFMPKRWAYLKREAEKSFIQLHKPLIFASDKDGAVCHALEDQVSACGLSDAIHIACKDFFAFSPSSITAQPGLVMLNPPYGLRLGTRAESEKLFHEIIRKLKKDYKGWKVGLITPNRELVRNMPFPMRQYFFSHGGLKMTLLAGNVTP
jgi:putative N6-adenine-specific DNA methylase